MPREAQIDELLAARFGDNPWEFVEGAATTAADIGVSHPLIRTIGLFIARGADPVA